MATVTGEVEHPSACLFAPGGNLHSMRNRSPLRTARLTLPSRFCKGEFADFNRRIIADRATRHGLRFWTAR